MDTTTYDLGRLEHDELLELRELQTKMLDANGQPEDLSKLTFEELCELERLFLKMANEPYSWERVSVHVGADGKLYKANGEPWWEREPTTAYCHWCGHALGAVTYTNSSVPGVYCSEQCLENGQLTRHRSPTMNPPAVAPAPAPVKPVAPAGPAPAETPKLPSDGVLSAARQLDSILRFGA